MAVVLTMGETGLELELASSGDMVTPGKYAGYITSVPQYLPPPPSPLKVQLH